MCTAAAVLGAVTWIVWAALDQLFGRSVFGQIISVGGGVAVGTLAYARAVLWLQIGEAHQAAGFAARRVPLRWPAGRPRRARLACVPPHGRTRPSSATSRSSPTSTTGSRRWPTASSR